MDKQKIIKTDYDKEGDILIFSFTEKPQPALAEEAADEVWVRFDPENNKVITIEMLNFSSRLKSAFGHSLTYTERTDPESIEMLAFP